jgi:phosphopantothenoylcysteine decarboxylase / phosphopantothenate---cysteine ligase
MARILLGVSGGIAAYKALEFVRLATAAGHAVRVVQTRASQRFIGAASFAALTGAPVLVSEFEPDPARGAFPGEQPPAHAPLSHLELPARADVYLIAPASANTIAKLAAGMAEDMLSACALAASCPVLVAPAMNNRMYEHAATQANLRTLRERGVEVIGPEEGRLASEGEYGPGRLLEPLELLQACEAALARAVTTASDERTAHAGAAAGADAAAPLRGVRVLVTAGGTREPLDSVRFLGNSSSGRMGLALAQAAHARGAQVTLIAANVQLPRPAGVTCRGVCTAAELREACVEEFPNCDVLLMAAAVADFRPAAPIATKIKKAARDELVLELEPTVDVLGELARSRRAGQTLVGFAAEHGADALADARRKLIEKGLDAIVVNDISRADIGFDADENEVTILTAANGHAATASRGEHADGSEARAQLAQASEISVSKAPKLFVAETILDVVERLRGR